MSAARNAVPNNRRFSSSRDQGLTEGLAPAPIQPQDHSGNWRQDKSLEQEHEDAQADRPQPPSLYISRSRWKDSICTGGYLVFFAIWGTLARLGVQWLTFYPGAPVTISNLWANFAGTLVMGFLSEDKKLFSHTSDLATDSSTDSSERFRSLQRSEKPLKAKRQPVSAKVRKTIPLFIGLSTGFCGSFTSFSTFMRDIFFAISDDLPDTKAQASSAIASADAMVGHNGGYSFEAVIAIIILTVGLTLFALEIGAQLALALRPVLPPLSPRIVRHILDPLFVVLGYGCWLGAIFMSIWPPDRQGGPAAAVGGTEEWRGVALFACVFAPVGCLIRYWVSLKLNPIVDWFPLGTFAINIFGTAVLGMGYDIQHVPIGATGLVGGGIIGCQVLQGIEDGFCGALTTVSTWINEIHSLRRRHGWLYALASIAGGIAMMVIVMGSVYWSVGFTATACVTGR